MIKTPHKFLHRILFVAFFMAFSVGVTCGNPVPWFRSIAPHQGLSDTQVNCICKSESGYLWIGTSMGLNRFDGYRVKVFSTASRHNGSLPVNDVNSIAQDHEGNLWIDTPLGFCIFNPADESFTTDIQPWLNRHNISGKVGHVHFSADGGSWIEIYHKGIYCVQRNGATKFIATKQLPDARTTHLTSADGTCYATFDNGAVVAIDGETGKVKWTNNHISLLNGDDRQPYCTFVDSKGNMWVYGTHSLLLHEHSSGKWTTVCNYIVRDIAEDKKHRIWVATDHNGLIQLNTNGDVEQHFTAHAMQSNSLPDNTINCLLADADDTLWLGTYSSGLAYLCQSNQAYNQIDLGNICTIAQHRSGTLWCGTNDAGIITYNPADGTRQAIDVQRYGCGSNIVVSSLSHTDGSLWFGTYGGGLLRINADGTTQVYRKSPGGLASDNVWTLSQTPDGRVVIGTLGGGLQLLDLGTGKFASFTAADNNLASDYIATVDVDANRALLVGHSQYFSTIDLRSGNMGMKTKRAMVEDVGLCVNR